MAATSPAKTIETRETHMVIFSVILNLVNLGDLAFYLLEKSSRSVNIHRKCTDCKNVCSQVLAPTNVQRGTWGCTSTTEHTHTSWAIIIFRRHWSFVLPLLFAWPIPCVLVRVLHASKSCLGYSKCQRSACDVVPSRK